MLARERFMSQVVNCSKLVVPDLVGRPARIARSRQNFKPSESDRQKGVCVFLQLAVVLPLLFSSCRSRLRLRLRLRLMARADFLPEGEGRGEDLTWQVREFGRR